jgi:hypothetical protein
LLLAVLLTGPLPAADYQPYPDAGISAEQWQDYFDIVLLEFADTMQEVADVKMVVFDDASTSTWYAFTLPDNPAHPAWITRRIIAQDGAFYIEQIGYFAGDEAAFADLYDAYAELADEVRQQLESAQLQENADSD